MPNLDDILRDMERRLSAVEAKLGTAPAPSVVTPPVAPQPLPSFQPKVARSEPGGAGSLFGIVGICFLLLAAVFFLKLTIDSGWLTPARQVFLAVFFGLGCLGLPHFVRRLGDDYGALLSGTGAAILHLCWFGAYKIHGLIDPHTALLLATGVGALTVLTNVRVGNAVFVLVAVAGTYLSVPLIGFQLDDISNLSSFLLIWNISFSMLAFFLKRRDVLLVAAYFAVFTVGVLSLGSVNDPVLVRQFLLLQGVQFAIFSIAMLAFSLVHRLPLAKEEAWSLCVLLLAYYGNLYFLLDHLLPKSAPWIATAFSVLVLGFYQLATRYFKKELPSGDALSTFAALALSHSLFLKITPDSAKPLFALVLAGFLAMLGKRLTGGAVLVAIAVVGYGALMTFTSELPLDTRLAYNFAFGLAALAAVFSRNVHNITLGSLLLGFAHLEMLCALYRFSLKLEVGGSLFVSVTWGVYAVLVLLWATARKDKTIGQSAVLILAAVALKAAFYDVLATGNLVRVLSLLAAGLLLYACGWIFNRMKSWG